MSRGALAELKSERAQSFLTQLKTAVMTLESGSFKAQGTSTQGLRLNYEFGKSPL